MLSTHATDRQLITENPLLRGTFDLRWATQREVLYALHDATKILHRRAAEVVQYPLGFYRVTLSGNRHTDGFNFHVWPPDIVRNESIHTHVFDLDSRIVGGVVEDHLWSVNEDSGNHT